MKRLRATAKEKERETISFRKVFSKQTAKAVAERGTRGTREPEEPEEQDESEFHLFHDTKYSEPVLWTFQSACKITNKGHQPDKWRKVKSMQYVKMMNTTVKVYSEKQFNKDIPSRTSILKRSSVVQNKNIYI